jgi:hypothetical protein
MNRNCYTCSVRKENCGEAKALRPMEWLDHVCVLWFPKDDMVKVILDKADSRKEGMITYE